MAGREPDMGKTRIGTPVPAARTTPSVVAERVGEPELQAGQRIHQYELIRELGRGGMGVVYAARDLKLGRRVAIKLLLDRDREVAERFLIEARATAQCNHDNIVIVYEVDEYAGTPYMVLELLEGQTLRAVMGRRLAPSRVVEIGLQIARALARAHERGIVHRDLKPDNVFLTTTGQVKVLDFGIAKPMGQAERDRIERVDRGGRAQRPGDSQLTRDGALVGTLPYMSLEQWGVGELDALADVWAIGINLFEMLAGHHPLPAEASSPTRLFTFLTGDDPMPAIDAIVPDVPPPLARLVDRCLRKAKAERPTAAELVRRFEAMLPGRVTGTLEAVDNPYVGLAAFQETDADRFFGRAGDIARMVARVRERPLTAVVGSSGVGKSSFVRAGVAPALKASGERWEVLTLRPGRHPLAALASTVERAGITQLRNEPGYIGFMLRERARSLDGQLLVFVDQFEELYTLVQDAGERRAFTAALLAIADDAAAPLRVVLSMRADFLDRVADDARFTEELSRGLHFQAPPDRHGLRDALVQPLAHAGITGSRSEAIVDAMVDALASTAGALPLLQFTAAKLWEARDADRRLLTRASYERLGGISGALAAHADDVIARLDTRSQALARRVFRMLVTPERTRAIVELDDLRGLSADRAEVERLVDRLVADRLLVVQRGSVEIVHESLIARWPALQRWLDEDADDVAMIAQLGAAAKPWDAKGRPNGMLWQGDALDSRAAHAGTQGAAAPLRRVGSPRAIAHSSTPRSRSPAAAGGSVPPRWPRRSPCSRPARSARASPVHLRVRVAEERASAEATHAREEADRAATEATRASEALAAEQAEEKLRRAAEKSNQDLATTVQHEETAVDESNKEVRESREALEAKNAALEAALRDARHEREAAEKASSAAKDSEAKFKTANAQLADKLAHEQARVKALEEAKKDLSTQLKE